MRLSRNFLLAEVACSCGCVTTPEDISSELVRQLQKLRDKLGLPIRINSGYRCPKHNAAVGGVRNSQHVKGRAVDIDTTKYSGSDKHRLLRLIYTVGGFTGVGVYPTFIHLDVRDGSETTWMG